MSSGMLRRVASYKLTNLSEVLTASIIIVVVLMMEVVSTSEMSVNFCQSTRHITSDDGYV
jgi:hypothetical protein